MGGYRVVIAADTYHVASEMDLEGLKAQILSAVHDGGAFVRFAGPGRPETQVLITSTTALKIETIAEVTGTPSDWDSDLDAPGDTDGYRLFDDF